MSANIKSFFLHVPQRFVVCALCSAAIAVCAMDHHTFIINIVGQQYLVGRNMSQCPPLIGQWEADLDPAHPGNHLFWDEEVMRAITQAFNFGYLVALMPSGMLADACGAKTIIWLGLLTSSLATLASPALAQISPLHFIIVRFVQGVGQAMVIPSIGSLMVQWIPLTERATSSAVVCVGHYVGYASGHWISRLNEYNITSSWKTSFYVAAAIGIFYNALWLALVFDRPATSPYISPEEQDLIYRSTNMARVGFYRRPFFPLCSVLLSVPVLSLLSICCASSWTQAILVNHFHTYLDQIPRITHTVTEAVTMSAVTVVVPSTFFWGVVSDCLVNRKYMSRTNNRKAFGLISNISILPFVLAIPIVNCDWRKAGWLYTAAIYFRGLFYSLGLTNALDLTPQHAGALFALLVTITCIASIISWEFVFTMMMDIDDIDQWWFVFEGCSFLLVVLSAPYMFYCSAEVQSWDSKRHSYFLRRSDVLPNFFTKQRPSGSPEVNNVRESLPDISGVRPSVISQDQSSNTTNV